MAIVSHLDLEAGQAGIPVELTVVPVGLSVAPAHGPLVGLTALERVERESERDGGRWKESERERDRQRAR